MTGSHIKKHLGKSIDTAMGHLHTNRQGVKQTSRKYIDTDLGDSRKTDLVFVLP